MTAPLRIAYLLVYCSGSHPYTHRELLGSIVKQGGILCTEDRRGLAPEEALAVNLASVWIESENDLIYDLRHVVEHGSFLADLDLP
jgi:hypothetical protein